jgi:hypothetical protein
MKQEVWNLVRLLREPTSEAQLISRQAAVSFVLAALSLVSAALAFILPALTFMFAAFSFILVALFFVFAAFFIYTTFDAVSSDFMHYELEALSSYIQYNILTATLFLHTVQYTCGNIIIHTIYLRQRY